jgi:hypothetical protein
VKLDQLVTEDRRALVPDGVYWCLLPRGMGAVELYPVQKPTVEGACVFFSGVGLRGSLYVPIVNGVASRVFASKDAANGTIREASK